MPKKISYCKVQKCETRCSGLGYCLRHYKQIKRHGKIMPTIYEARELIEKDDYCLIQIGVGAKNGYAKVDKDNKWLNEYKWHISNGYAKTRINKKYVAMHMMVAGKEGGQEIDHINRDKLDNRKENLRHVTHQQNTLNTPTRAKSGYRGVRYVDEMNKYAVQIWDGNKVIHIGSFEDIKEAAKEYNKMARKLKGKYAVLNEGVCDGR